MARSDIVVLDDDGRDRIGWTVSSGISDSQLTTLAGSFCLGIIDDAAAIDRTPPLADGFGLMIPSMLHGATVNDFGTAVENTHAGEGDAICRNRGVLLL